MSLFFPLASPLPHFWKISFWLLWLWEEIDFVPPSCSVKIGRIAQHSIDTLAEKETWECKKIVVELLFNLYLVHTNKTSPSKLLK